MKKRQAEMFKWKRRQVKKLKPTFEGKVTNAVDLIYSLYEGANYVYDKLRKRGITDLKMPNYLIKDFVDKENMSSSQIERWLRLSRLGRLRASIDYSKVDHKFHIAESNLRWNSKANLRTVYCARDELGTISFLGTMPQFYNLDGVEVGYYATFATKKSIDKTINYPDQIEPMIEYESEYKALIWKLRYAQEKQYSAETVNYLKTELDVVRAFRHN